MAVTDGAIKHAFVHRMRATRRSRRIAALVLAALLILALIPQSRHAIERVLHIRGVLTGSACNQGANGAGAGNTMGIVPTPDGDGYWLVRDDGGVFTSGDAPFLLSANGHIQTATSAIAATPSGRGYWVTEQRGMVWTFGDAGCHGGMYDTSLNKPIVGMASTASGNGYWLVGGDGGIFTFGDAVMHGGMGGQTLNAPVVGMAATPSGNGYWLVGADGGVFTFGDALYLGGMAGVHLAAPITAIVPTPGPNQGYYLIGKDGGVDNFGAAVLMGSWSGRIPGNDVVGAGLNLRGHGMWLARGMGQVVTLGDAGVYP
jgi:hypothetical protein